MQVISGAVAESFSQPEQKPPLAHATLALRTAANQARALKSSGSAFLYQKLKSGFGAVDTFSKLHDRIRFDDRRSNAPVLVCMLAGYKPDLWPFVFPRFRQALPAADVCIISPGLRSEPLARICRDAGWSYLSTSVNDVSLAQNICYRLHPAADMIVKTDEDMFLLPDTVQTVLTEYRNIKAAGIVDPGFVAPMIPLNGFCYRHLFEILGLLDEYEATFGRARLATSGLPVHKDPAAAQWIWERTGHLTEIAARLRETQPIHLMCPIQFSIGLIAFERRFWEAIGYLRVNRRRILAGISTLGADEAHLCTQAIEMSRPAVVTTAALAGHFSFGPQYGAQLELLRSRPDLFTE
jgi:hypothetical protein